MLGVQKSCRAISSSSNSWTDKLTCKSKDQLSKEQSFFRVLFFGSLPQGATHTLGWVFPHWLRQPIQYPTDTLTGKPDGDSPSLGFTPQVILDCVRLTIKTNHHTRYFGYPIHCSILHFLNIHYLLRSKQQATQQWKMNESLCVNTFT